MFQEVVPQVDRNGPDDHHLPIGRVPASESASSRDSNSSNDFVKIDDSDMAEIPGDLLVDYGSRMADEVLQHVTGAGDSTPANEVGLT